LRILVVAVALFPLGLLPSANAGEAGPWFVGGSLGSADSHADRTELNRELANTGYDARVVSVDDSGTGYRLFVGYRFKESLSVEGGYLDLGEVGLTISGQFDDVDEFLDSIRETHPHSAAGVYLAGSYNWYFYKGWSLLARTGLFLGSSDYSTTSEDIAAAAVSDDSSEAAFFFGAGCQYDINSIWGLQASWERFSLDGDGVDFLSASLIYRFDWPFGD
jgi:OOP family OmpA-OmpF porin